jgi:predicted RNase H-like HicB family nuclease
MENARYIYMQEGDDWVGYLEEFPGYRTQGKSQKELKGNLADLYRELTSGRIPHVCRVA